jgi:hypothetical protein
MPFDSPGDDPFGDIQILTDVRNRIADRRRWVQGAFWDGDRQCLVAALSVASLSRDFSRPSQLERRLARILVRHLPRNAGLSKFLIFSTARFRLMAFNDRRRTQHADVLALLDQTIGHLASRMPANARV